MSANMKACKMAAAAMAFALWSAGVAQATWIKLDDFDSYNTGNLEGQGGWVKASTSNTSTVIADPTDSNNQVASVTDSAGSVGHAIYRSLGAAEIPNNTTSTVFFRFYTTSTTPNFSLGLTDVAAPSGAPTYAINESQFVAGTTGSAMQVRDNVGLKSLGTYTASTWQNIWVVIDNAANTQTFYRSTGTDDGTLIGTGAYSFRATDTSSIKTLQLHSNSTTSSVLVDDIYITSGAVTTMIPEPATLGLIGVVGIAMILRRRIVRE